MPPLGKCFKAAFAAACFFSSWLHIGSLHHSTIFDIYAPINGANAQGFATIISYFKLL